MPEFIALPIWHGSEPYLKWVSEQTADEPAAKIVVEGNGRSEKEEGEKGEK